MRDNCPVVRLFSSFCYTRCLPKMSVMASLAMCQAPVPHVDQKINLHDLICHDRILSMLLPLLMPKCLCYCPNLLLMPKAGKGRSKSERQKLIAAEPTAARNFAGMDLKRWSYHVRVVQKKDVRRFPHVLSRTN